MSSGVALEEEEEALQVENALEVESGGESGRENVPFPGEEEECFEFFGSLKAAL